MNQGHPTPPPPDEFSLPSSTAGRLLFWSLTALFVGFSLGVVLSEITILSQPDCIEGKSTIIAEPFAQ